MIQILCRSLAAVIVAFVASAPLSAYAESAEETTRTQPQDTIEGQLETVPLTAVSVPSDLPDIELSGDIELTTGSESVVSAEKPAEAADHEASDSVDEAISESVDVAVEGSDASASEDVSSDRETALTEAAPAELSDIFRITDHVLDDERIAIFYIDHMPVLTFVEQSVTGAKDIGAEANDNLLLRAETVARQVDEFYRAEGNPDTILVSWEAEAEEYVVTLEGERLVAIDDATRYFNTTERHYTDALHATNRLRVLMGGTDDLTEVEGAPEPEPVAAIADWGVASTFSGQASWYGPGFNGRQTASGEIFNQNAMTAAHRTLPFGTQVRVTNVNNNRFVIVRINDRGPFSHGRVIDLSAGAAREIGLDRAGVGPVRVEVLTD
ncbi:MAG: septal ring lytic transglycosylase RlpA family protein [Leptolyngbyaceae cyanobacterium]